MKAWCALCTCRLQDYNLSWCPTSVLMPKSLLELRITAQGFCLYVSHGNVVMELFCESCLRHAPRIPVWTSTSAGSCPVMPVWIHLQINSFEEAWEIQVATVATNACSDSSKHVSCVLHLPSCFHNPTWKHAFHLIGNSYTTNCTCLSCHLSQHLRLHLSGKSEKTCSRNNL